ncbi:MAG: DUF4332 domain-containing protein [Bdellovibrionota bacterium]|nr:DUF4332 domain-containing protein [Deltaproteobacteria bacterium]
MSYKIEEIEGIGPSYAEKLATAGITTTDDLITQCATPAGRKTTAETTGITTSTLLTFTNKADLMRVKGVGSEYSDLLEASGVDTVKELRTRNATNLTTKLAEVNAEKNLTRTVPSETVVTGWIEAAKTMDTTITY